MKSFHPMVPLDRPSLRSSAPISFGRHLMILGWVVLGLGGFGAASAQNTAQPSSALPGQTLPSQMPAYPSISPVAAPPVYGNAQAPSIPSYQPPVVAPNPLLQSTPASASPSLAQPSPAQPSPAQSGPAQPFQPQAASAQPASAPSGLPPLPPQSELDRYTQTYFPVSDEQIRKLHQLVNDRQRAVAAPVKPPKPVTGIIAVSMAPGVTPPLIRTYMGDTTSFVVVDSSGAPWPVENFRIGNAAAFQLYRLDAGQGSTFAIDTAAPYAQSNLVLKLAGVATPVVIDVISGQAEFDARLEVRVAGHGPNAIVTSTSIPQGTDSRLLPVLNGIPPEGGKSLSATGLEGVRAWMMPSGRMVVLTPIPIVSPASPSFVSSADGTHVYEFQPTTQLLGLAEGRFVPIRVAGW